MLWIVLLLAAGFLVFRAVSRTFKFIVFLVVCLLLFYLIYRTTYSWVLFTGEKAGNDFGVVGKMPYYSDVKWWFENLWYELTIRFR